MNVRRLIAVIALAATALPLSQAVLSGACVHADAAEQVASHGSHPATHGPAHDGTPHQPAPSHDVPSCPMSGAMVSACSGTAIATPVLVATALAVVSAPRMTPTFVAPSSVSGTDLFHPPRA